MNFDDNPQEAKYRATVRAWIEANAPDMSVLAPEERRPWQEKHKAIATKWQATKADAGYACISWPKERGGAGGTSIEEAIFNQEEARAGVQFTYFMTGLHMLLPALMEHSHDEASLARVAPAVRGDEIWCQLFSEPSSGSDSAATRTMAVQDGDCWVLNGQKVWNSGAQASDFGMVIARTDADVPKHKGLSAFWLDMKTPGLVVRPIKMMSGDSELNEVFLEDVRIPANQMIGAPGDGWKVVISTLMNERAALGSGTGLTWRDIMEVARNSPAFDGTTLEDPAFREWLADYYVSAEAIRLLSFRTLTALSHGKAPGPEGSAGKLLWATQTQELTNQAMDIQDHFGLIDDPEIAMLDGGFQHRFLWAPALRLGGGTDEIMKNIIAGFNGGNPKWLAISRDRFISNGAHKNIPTTLYNSECSMTPVILFLSDHKAETLERVVAKVQAFAAENDSADAKFILAAGNSGIEAATNIVVEQAQKTMLLLVYGIVGALVWWEFKSFRVMLAIMIPLFITEVLCKVIMVQLNLGIKVATLPVIALGVGIGVDYGIYIYNRLESFLAKGLNFKDAYFETLRSTGVAVALTAVTLALGVFTWAFSAIKFQADMGMLLAFMFLWNMVGAVILIPALVRLFAFGAVKKRFGPSVEAPGR